MIISEARQKKIQILQKFSAQKTNCRSQIAEGWDRPIYPTEFHEYDEVWKIMLIIYWIHLQLKGTNMERGGTHVEDHGFLWRRNLHNLLKQQIEVKRHKI